MDDLDELRRATRGLRRQTVKHNLRMWLDGDPSLRSGFIAMSPELTRLDKCVSKLERLACGIRTDLIPDHCP